METPEFGNGSTIVFGTSGFTARILKIGHDGNEIEEVPTSHLGTTNADGSGDEFGGKTWKPGKLQEAGTVQLRIQFDADNLPPLGVLETITITFAQGEGEASPTTWAGQGFIRAAGGVELENDVVAEQDVELRLSGVWTKTDAVAA